MKVTLTWFLRRYYALILTGISVLLFVLIFKKNSLSQKQLKQVQIVKECYAFKSTNRSVKLLDDIMMSKPKIDTTIFFHDTSCKNGTVSFTPRQACAIESAARWNSNRNIFVLFAAPVGLPSDGSTDSPILKILSTYPNVHYRNVDWYNYAVGTPADEWVKQDKMLTTEHFMGHLADFIRLLSLYKFGGIHLDLDFVVQKSFDKLAPNFVGAQDSFGVQNAVMGFQSKEVGHKIVEIILRNFTNHYSTKIWYANGPTLLTKIVRKICHTTSLTDLKPENCWGLKVYNPWAFFPNHYSHWRDVNKTDPTKVKELQEQFKDAFAVHFNNKVTYQFKMKKSERKNIYEILAEKNCPKVWQASESF